MKCSVCGKEFGTGNNCQHCGSDKFTGLGNYNGYNAPVGNGKSQIRVKDMDSPSTSYMHQTENVGAMACYACGEIIPSDSKFCPYCSRELFVVCPKCGHKYSSQFPACNQCGTNRNKYYEQLRKEKLESEIARVRKEEGDSAAIKIRTREIENSQRTKASTAEGRAELERERRYIDECRKKWRNQ
jgi:RNA polymerase subunit RPABC4/transcription elongation factor Spt4